MQIYVVFAKIQINKHVKLAKIQTNNSPKLTKIQTNKCVELTKIQTGSGPNSSNTPTTLAIFSLTRIPA